MKETISIVIFGFITSLLIQSYVNYQQTNRLNEHKKVIELQQKQINQLIIHCEYERNKQNHN